MSTAPDDFGPDYDPYVSKSLENQPEPPHPVELDDPVPFDPTRHEHDWLPHPIYTMTGVVAGHTYTCRSPACEEIGYSERIQEVIPIREGVL